MTAHTLQPKPIFHISSVANPKQVVLRFLEAISILEQKCGVADVHVTGSYLPGFIRPGTFLWKNICCSVGLCVEVDGLFLFSLWTEILSYRDRIPFIILGLALALLTDIETCLSMPCLTGHFLAFSSYGGHQSCALTRHAGLAFLWPMHVLLPEHHRPYRVKGLWKEDCHVTHRIQCSRKWVIKSRSRRCVRECCSCPHLLPSMYTCRKLFDAFLHYKT